MTFRTGDVILHKPSGEKWIVAWGNDREVICCGWPESFADTLDCEMINPATDREHWRLVEEVAKHPDTPRGSRCWGLLEARREAECVEMMHI